MKFLPAEGIIKNLEIKVGELSKDLEDTRKAVSQLELQKQKYAETLAEKDKLITNLRKY